MARRKMRLATFKVGIQHSDTNVGNTGAANVESFDFLETASSRTTTGATQTITQERTTGDRVNVGDIVKYVNLFIEIGPRDTIDAVSDRTGWCEYAIVMVKESETAVQTTNLGTKTLGDVCTHMFRNECIWTGAFPMGTAQPNSTSIIVKVPKFKQKIRLGDQWRFLLHFRSVNAASTSTASVRFIQSVMYKAYQ